jgi:hypothetical protein
MSTFGRCCNTLTRLAAGSSTHSHMSTARNARNSFRTYTLFSASLMPISCRSQPPAQDMTGASESAWSYIVPFGWRHCLPCFATRSSGSVCHPLSSIPLQLSDKSPWNLMGHLLERSRSTIPIFVIRCRSSGLMRDHVPNMRSWKDPCARYCD